MKKIVSSENLLDIIPFEKGLLFIIKEEKENGNAIASFYAYDQDEDKILAIKKRDFLYCKFGEKYLEIAEELGDFISCKVSPLSNKGVAVLYDDGDMLIFNSSGKISWSGKLLYQDNVVQSLAVDGKSIWCTVPDFNAVISYSPSEGRVLLRIGGGSSTAFSKPVSVSKHIEKLYICNANSFKIRTIKLDDYSVKDYKTFNEPVLNYFKIYKKEYALLSSGLYLIE